MKVTATASQWLMVDEDGNDVENPEAPTIYIDEDGNQVMELSLDEAIALADSLLLVILEARGWVEGYMPISGNTTNFLYSLRATTTHTGGMHAENQVRR